MASNENKTYRSRRPVKTAIIVFFVLLAVLIVIAFGIFFGFKRYIVYTDDGVRLDIPWLQESDLPEE